MGTNGTQDQQTERAPHGRNIAERVTRAARRWASSKANAMNDANSAMLNTADYNPYRGDAKFARIPESDFAAFTRDALIELLDWHNVQEPQFKMGQYTGLVLEKPALSITIGDSEFQILIIKK